MCAFTRRALIPPTGNYATGIRCCPRYWRPPVLLPVIPGTGVSGVVEAVAGDVQGFSLGDEASGMVRFPSFGESAAYTEYVAAPASDLALKPAVSITYTRARAPMAGLTAWQFLIKLGHNEANPLQPEMHQPVPLHGKKVLVNGAAGGVDTLVCSRRNGRVRRSSRSHRARRSRSCASSAPTNSSTTHEELS